MIFGDSCQHFPTNDIDFEKHFLFQKYNFRFRKHISFFQKIILKKQCRNIWNGTMRTFRPTIVRFWNSSRCVLMFKSLNVAYKFLNDE